MPRGRPRADLRVTPEDLTTLTRWTARRKTAQALALRARVILRSATGLPNTQVAAELGLTAHTVGKWRRRYNPAGRGGAARRAPPRGAAPHQR